MENLKQMKEMLVGCVQGQLSNIAAADYHELGAAVDMIKDLAEAIYYCTITEAMEEKEEQKYYMPMMDYNQNYRDTDKEHGRMYYSGGGTPGTTTGSHTGRAGYQEWEYPSMKLGMRDSREGRSPMSRRSYMEAKEMHHDKAAKMKELENYMQELSTDITEMIYDASPEEKQILQKKLNVLISKIDV